MIFFPEYEAEHNEPRIYKNDVHGSLLEVYNESDCNYMGSESPLMARLQLGKYFVRNLTISYEII